MMRTPEKMYRGELAEPAFPYPGYAVSEMGWLKHLEMALDRVWEWTSDGGSSAVEVDALPAVAYVLAWLSRNDSLKCSAILAITLQVMLAIYATVNASVAIVVHAMQLTAYGRALASTGGYAGLVSQPAALWTMLRHGAQILSIAVVILTVAPAAAAGVLLTAIYGWALKDGIYGFDELRESLVRAFEGLAAHDATVTMIDDQAQHGVQVNIPDEYGMVTESRTLSTERCARLTGLSEPSVLEVMFTGGRIAGTLSAMPNIPERVQKSKTWPMSTAREIRLVLAAIVATVVRLGLFIWAAALAVFWIAGSLILVAYETTAKSVANGMTRAILVASGGKPANLVLLVAELVNLSGREHPW
jgi:hypothetical protein